MQQADSLSGSGSTLPLPLRWPTVLAVLICLTVIRLITAGSIVLVDDEAYYRLWSLHPAVGYYDHPPMIAWWIGIGRFLVGDNPLGIRLLSVLSVFVESLVLWRIAVIIFDRRTAGIAVLFFNAMFIIGVGAVLATPDAPSILFWLLCLWAMAELQKSGNGKWWLAVGFFAGCGLLSKYTNFFLGVGIVLWLVWTPALRHWLLSKWLWLGGILAFVVFLPVLMWNIEYGGASFAKQFGRLVPRDWTFANVLEFIGIIGIAVNPLLLLFLLPGIAKTARETFVAKIPYASLLFLTTVPLLAYLFFHAFHSEIQQNWYSPLMPAFALVSAAIAAGFENRAGKPGKLMRIWCAGTILVGVAAALLIYLHSYSPFSEGMGRRDPTLRTKGWQELGVEIEQLAKSYGAKWIATTNYSYTGQLSYALRDKLPVIQLTDRIRYVMAPEPDLKLLVQPGLYVALLRRDQATYIWLRFKEIAQVDTLQRQAGEVVLDEVQVYYFTGAAKYPFGPLDICDIRGNFYNPISDPKCAQLHKRFSK